MCICRPVMHNIFLFCYYLHMLSQITRAIYSRTKYNKIYLTETVSESAIKYILQKQSVKVWNRFNRFRCNPMVSFFELRNEPGASIQSRNIYTSC
jgi:hypothetical protein